jgi:hypothetical protein
MSGAGVSCPFCGSADVELVSAWGGQLITSQLRCRGCNTHFEALREDFAASRVGGAGQDRGRPGDVEPSR